MRHLRDRYAIAGLGVTQVGKRPGVSARRLQAEAVRQAIEDAGLRRQDIDGYIYQASPSGLFRDDAVPRHLGLPTKFLWQLENGGSSCGAMVAAAVGAIEAGLANHVVCAYGDNSYTATVSGQASPFGTGVGGASLLAVYGLLGAVGPHALEATRHMAVYGTTSEQLGAIAVAQRQRACLNPEATFYGRPITLEDYQYSPMVAEPLRRLDCCLISDGGVALIVTTAERARDLKKPPVYIMGLGQGHQVEGIVSAKEQFTRLGVASARESAFGMAGIGLRDIDVAQLYDCFTITVLLQLEDYGFCDKGEGGAFVDEGHLGPQGKVPINTGGGMLSGWYCEGFTAMSEAVRQLRGECGERQVKDAETCLVTGHGITDPMAGGYSHSTVILRR